MPDAVATAAPNDETGKPKRRSQVGRTNKPRPLYVLLSKALPDDVEIVGTTRKAEDALESIDTGNAKAYVRLMTK